MQIETKVAEPTRKYHEKRKKTEHRILEASRELLIEKRSGAFSLDEAAARAGMARRTLYNHFENRETLIYRASAPLLESGIAKMELILKQPVIRLEEILHLCLHLWDEFGKNLEIFYCIQFEDCPELIPLHDSFVSKYMELFQRSGEFEEDSQSLKRVKAAVLYKSFVPILKPLVRIANYKQLFIRSMTNLMEGLSEPDPGSHPTSDL